jgi:hypothetical protein
LINIFFQALIYKKEALIVSFHETTYAEEIVSKIKREEIHGITLIRHILPFPLILIKYDSVLSKDCFLKNYAVIIRNSAPSFEIGFTAK